MNIGLTLTFEKKNINKEKLELGSLECKINSLILYMHIIYVETVEWLVSMVYVLLRKDIANTQKKRKWK